MLRGQWTSGAGETEIRSLYLATASDFVALSRRSSRSALSRHKIDSSCRFCASTASAVVTAWLANSAARSRRYFAVSIDALPLPLKRVGYAMLQKCTLAARKSFIFLRSATFVGHFFAQPLRETLRRSR